MSDFIVTVFDISDITKPKQIDEFPIKAETKADASDKSHSITDVKFAEIKRMISIRKI